jgi:hypothetical protein
MRGAGHRAGRRKKLNIRQTSTPRDYLTTQEA